MTTPVVILTGAGRGIGLATLKHLLGLPSPPNVLAVSRTISPALRSLAVAHSNLETVSVDFATPLADLRPEIESSIIGTAVSRWGRVDALLLNHGVLEPISKVADADASDWEVVYRVNVLAGVEVVRAALPQLRKVHGRVILVSSGAATAAYTGWGAYGASKAAMNHFNMTLAREEPDVTSVAVRPGVVDTDMQVALREVHGKVMPAEEHSKFIELKRSGAIVKPEDVGAVLGNLCLKADKGLTGKFVSWDEEALAAYR
ncbi:hypothetical protein TWF696_008750 [Orbilia brochopaga]|uniref:NAD(P)-binding protein n=1 Tax=Orbilia brochopaga TaxID=3140254 RepID=A0AAV9UIU2_9PEZI